MMVRYMPNALGNLKATLLEAAAWNHILQIERPGLAGSISRKKTERESLIILIVGGDSAAASANSTS
jgi:hypothetical protein